MHCAAALRDMARSAKGRHDIPRSKRDIFRVLRARDGPPARERVCLCATWRFT
jgi:hypothetical protein